MSLPRPKRVVGPGCVLAVLLVNACSFDQSDDVHKQLEQATVFLPQAQCSGIAVSQRLVLSAGHCFTGPGIIEAITHDGNVVELRPRFALRSDSTDDLPVVAKFDAAIYQRVDDQSFAKYIDIRVNSPSEFQDGRLSFLAAGHLKSEEFSFVTRAVTGLGFEDFNDFTRRIIPPPGQPIATRRARYSDDDTALSFKGDIGRGMSGGPIVEVQETPEAIELQVVGLVMGGTRDCGEGCGQNGRATSMIQLLSVLSSLAPDLALELGAAPVADTRFPRRFLAPGAGISAYVPTLAIDGFELSGVSLFSFTVEGSCRITNTRFVYSSLDDVDLSNCELENVVFDKVVYSQNATFPEDWSPDQSTNIGPLPHRDEEPLRVGFDGGNYDGIFVPHWLSLENESFRGATLNGARLQTPKTAKANFDDASLVGAMINGGGPTNSSEIPSLHGADLRGSTLRFHPSDESDDYDFVDAAIVDQHTTLFDSGEHLEPFADLPEASGARPSVRFVDEIVASNKLLPPHRDAGAMLLERPWADTERALVSDLMLDWTRAYPHFFGQIAGLQLNFERIGAFPSYRGEPPYAVADPTNALAASLFIDPSTAPFTTNGTIILTDRALDINTNLSGVPRVHLTLFHELVHMTDKVTSPYSVSSSAIPFPGVFDRWYVRPPQADATRPELNLSLEEAWSRYLALRAEARDQQALEYSYAYATRYGYPSIYALFSIGGQPQEVKAELVAFGALDPRFGDYAHPHIVAAVDFLLNHARNRIVVAG